MQFALVCTNLMLSGAYCSLQIRMMESICVLGILCVCFVFGYGGHLLRTIVACAYPGYRSLKAILTDDKDDDMAWLRYWVVLASFSLVELVLDLILSWLPGYLIAKCSFL